MFKLKLLTATRTIEQTMPFMLYRLLLCLGLGLVLLLACLIGAGTVIGFGSFSKNPASFAAFGATLGLLASFYAAYRLRGVWLYSLSASHLALLATQIRGDSIPEGAAQIGYAKQRVSTCFPARADLEALDQATCASLMSLAALKCPVLFAQQPLLQKAVQGLAGWLFAANRQTVLAWYFYTDADNGWRSARTAISALSAHFGDVFRLRLILSLFEWLGFLLACYLMLYPADAVAAALPVAIGLWEYVFAVVFAYGLKMAFLEPISEAALMDSVFSHIEAKPAEEAALSEASPAFRDIQQRSL